MDSNKSNEINPTNKGIINLHDVPPGLSNPSSLLWELGRPIDRISIQCNQDSLSLPKEVETLRSKIQQKKSQDFFNGPIATINELVVDDSELTIITALSDFYSYLASSYHFRETQGDNPVRPLAVQCAILLPGDKLLVERRVNVHDMLGKLSLFGGALSPTDLDPADAMRKILHKKMGINTDVSQIQATGFDRDNINNIYCIFFLLKISEDAARDLYSNFMNKLRAKEKIFYSVSLRQENQFVERLLEHNDIGNWNPAGFDNLLYTLAALKLRTPEEIEEICKNAHQRIDALSYQYPIQAILGDDL